MNCESLLSQSKCQIMYQNETWLCNLTKIYLFFSIFQSEKVCQIDVSQGTASRKNESKFRIQKKIIRILGEKICQIDVGETRFVFPVQEKRNSEFGFETKLFVFWVKKIVKLT